MRRIWRSLMWKTTVAGAGVACWLIPGSAAAQVRTEASPASLVNPADSDGAAGLFERNGLFMVAGGVLPAGRASFFLEEGGADTPVAAKDVQPVALADGAVGLRNAGRTYEVGMPQGLACPLGQFAARDGLIAYTVPKFIDDDAREAMMRADIVHHRIAREFDGTPFVKLLKVADFGATVPLPSPLQEQIIADVNRDNGIGKLVLTAADDSDSMIGSYINTGMQVTYHVYLMPATGKAEIGGVPLRYFWKMEPDSAGGVFSVEMYAQNWAPGTHLSPPGAQPTQYDVVNFFQVAGLFHQLHETDAAGFGSFVNAVCAKTGGSGA